MDDLSSAVERLIRESKVHANVAQDLIITTKDRLKLCLIEHRELQQIKQAWAVPLGILAPIVLTLVTADFKRMLGIEGDTWRAIFIVFGAISLFWLVRDAVRAFRKPAVGIDAIIEELTTRRQGATTSVTTGP